MLLGCACRPIAMTIPDNELIAEVLLASEGFSSAKPLASKLVALFKLAREGLSHQQHYDWGLRALKTALGAAGRLLRQVCRVLWCGVLNCMKCMCSTSLTAFCFPLTKMHNEAMSSAPADRYNLNNVCCLCCGAAVAAARRQPGCATSGGRDGCSSACCVCHQAAHIDLPRCITPPRPHC